MYATREDYISLYGEIEEAQFNRLALEADRIMDTHTTGIDNVKKLKIAFPAAEQPNITACACALVNFLKQVSDAETSTASARGYEETANGLKGKVVSSMSAGNESLSFTATTDGTAIDKAISDTDAKQAYIREIIAKWLSGLTDANGVNLLYMGRYPRRLLDV